MHPETAIDALKVWDRGEPQFTVELGGLGPGYEQAIHVLVFELIRDSAGQPLPTFHRSDKPTRQEMEAWQRWGDGTVRRIDSSALGFSGAQVGAAKSFAFRVLRDGWRKTLESAPNDRLIQVSNRWPKAS